LELVDCLDPDGEFVYEEMEGDDSDDEGESLARVQAELGLPDYSSVGCSLPSSPRQEVVFDEEKESDEEQEELSSSTTSPYAVGVCEEPTCLRKATHSWSMKQQPSRCDVHSFEGMR